MTGGRLSGSEVPAESSEPVARPQGAWWRDEASCASLDPMVFFDEENAERAKAICHGCAVEEICLIEALAAGERFGVWGGTDEVERRRLARSTHGTPERYQVGRCRCPECARAYAQKRAQARELERTLVAIMELRLLERGSATVIE